jgi:hypothetical protein
MGWGRWPEPKSCEVKKGTSLGKMPSRANGGLGIPQLLPRQTLGCIAVLLNTSLPRVIGYGERSVQAPSQIISIVLTVDVVLMTIQTIDIYQ